MKKLVLAALPLLLAGLGCDDKNFQGFENFPSKNGVWYGYVRDAKTGALLNFFAKNDTDTDNQTDNNGSTTQIWALVDGRLMTAKPCSVEDKKSTIQSGCFFVDGLPLDVKIAVFAVMAGYEPVSGTIFIDSTVEPVDGGADDSRTGLLFAKFPSVYKNVRLFPMNLNYDYTVLTKYNGSGIEGVLVHCFVNMDEENSFGIAGGGANYLSPTADWNSVVSGTTDANGTVTFAGADLVKGATYVCVANGPSLHDGMVLSDTSGATEFIPGVSANNVAMSLTAAGAGLMALYSNIDPGTEPIGATGSVTIVLNRAAVIFPGTANCQYGTVSAGTVNDETPPALTADVDDTDAESVTVALNAAGTTLTVTPNFATAIADDLRVDFTFGGIYLRVASGLGSAAIYRVGAPTNGAFLLQTYTTPADCAGFNVLAEDLSNVRTDGTQGTTGRLVN